MKIYTVIGNGSSHLIRASSRAQARRLFMALFYEVRLATAVDVAYWLERGHKIVGDEAPEQIDIEEVAR